ncbi:MAG: hypothetical protein U0R71_03235 [Solirubrobacterales bacterium]
MPEIIAIRYPDETLAGRAAEEVARCVYELGIDPDAAATVVCAYDGSSRLTTSRGQHASAAWSEFWSAQLEAVPARAGTSVLLLAVPSQTRDWLLAAISQFDGEEIAVHPDRAMRAPGDGPSVSRQR